MVSVAVRLLGPVQVQVGGVDLVLAGARQRALVAVLALEPDRVVPVETIVRAVWGDDAADHSHRLQQLVSTVRRVIEPAGTSGPPELLITRKPGYVLRATSVDVTDAERAVRDAEAARGRRDWGEVDVILAPVLDRWHPSALADVRDTALLAGVATRLDERRVDAAELRIEALIELDRCELALDELDPLVASHPFREGLRAKQMLALYRRGRQADALAVFRATRDVLVEGLGIDPSDELVELEARILRQDPTLRVAVDAVPSGADPFGATVRTQAPDEPHLRWPDGRCTVLVAGANVIGRLPTAAVRVDDSRVSRDHARIDRDGRSCQIVDLGSTNGTTVNGQPAAGQVLVPGDVVALGSIAFVFDDPAAPPTP